MRKRQVFVMTMMAFIVTLGFALVFLVLLWNEHERVIALPVPTGPFAVGRTMDVWTDSAHADDLAPKRGTPREVVVWIWYPASKTTRGVRADYLPASWRAALVRRRPRWMNAFVDHDLARVRTHSTIEALLSDAERRYPVVVLRAGLSALVASYATLAEDLASRGYVVVGFDAPFRTAVVVLPDGSIRTKTRENDPERAADTSEETRIVERLLAAWTSDTAFVLDRLEQFDAGQPSSRFAGRLDLRRVGVVGHSLGGAVAAQFCYVDRRCTAGIDIDGAPYGSVVREGLRVPFMFLLSDHSSDTDARSRRIRRDIRAVYDSIPADKRAEVEIRGANHYGFSDDVLLKSAMLERLLRAVGVMRMGGAEQLAVTRDYVGAFLGAYLKRGG
jgi:predicted dienelactone hydrolase